MPVLIHTGPQRRKSLRDFPLRLLVEGTAKVTGTNRDDSTVQAPKKREEKKIYPNDPCPCGSGKKYKQCCGRKLYAKN